MAKYLVFSLLIILGLSSFFYPPTDIKLVQSIESESFGLVDPKWSPDGEYILASSEKYNGLYVLNAKDLSIHKKFLEKENVGYAASWSADSKSILFRRKTNFVFYSYSINIETEKETNLSLAPDFFTCKGFFSEDKSKYYIDNNQNISYVNQENEVQQITHDGQYYQLVKHPLPNKIIAHQGSQILLIDIEKNEKTIIGQGIANSVSSDGRYIFYHLDKSSDGHHITESELYCYDTKKDKITTLTSTENIYELWPDISPDQTKLIYSDEKSGRLIISTITY